MRTLRDPNRLEEVSDPAIRQLLALRFAQLSEEHPACYEVGFIFNDGGFGIVLIVPKADAEPEVVGYCQQYATPAPLP